MSHDSVSCEGASASSCDVSLLSDGIVVQSASPNTKGGSAGKTSITESNESLISTPVVGSLMLLCVIFILVFFKRRSIIVPSTVIAASANVERIKRIEEVRTPVNTLPVKRKKKAITIIVEKPIAPLVASFLASDDVMALSGALVRASEASKWSIVFLEIIARDPLSYRRIPVMAAPPPMGQSHAETLVKEETKAIPIGDCEQETTKPQLNAPLTLSLSDIQPDQSPILEPIDSSTSDASPQAGNGKNSSWNLDKKPSLSSLSSASFPTNSATASHEPRRMTWDAKEQLAIVEKSHEAPSGAGVAVSSKRRRARRSRQRSKSLTVTSNLGVDASVPIFWPVYNPNGLPPAPPPGLCFRPPPGLDPPRRILRADAPAFTPRMDMPPSPSFSLAPPPPPYPITPTSRSERSSTLASVRSSRTTSTDGEVSFIHDFVNGNRIMRGTPTDDGHEADDEEESYYDEERPSVDLSFLE